MQVNATQYNIINYYDHHDRSINKKNVIVIYKKTITLFKKGLLRAMCLNWRIFLSQTR